MAQRPRKRRLLAPSVGDDGRLTNVERVFEELRQIQWLTNCSTKTLQTVLTAFRGKLGHLIKAIDQEALPANINHADKKMQNMVTLTLTLSLKQKFLTQNFKNVAYLNQIIGGLYGGHDNSCVWLCLYPCASYIDPISTC